MTRIERFSGFCARGGAACWHNRLAAASEAARVWTRVWKTALGTGACVLWDFYIFSKEGLRRVMRLFAFGGTSFCRFFFASEGYFWWTVLGIERNSSWCYNKVSFA